MKRFVFLAVLMAGPVAAQEPAAAPEAVAPADPRLRSIAYQPGQVIQLKVATNFQSTLIFGPDERVENVAIGDSEAWQASLNQRGDALFLKPLRGDSLTNMTVITDARVYSFELSAAYGPAPDMPFTVRFVHAASEAAPGGPVAQPGRYRMSGSRALRPAAISDDGVRTAIAWRDNQSIPAVFALDEQGEEVLLQGQMRDGRFEIDGVHRALIFRLAGDTARASRQRVRTPR